MKSMAIISRFIVQMRFIGPILDMCPPSTIYILRLVCSDLRRVVDWYCKVAFSINILLQQTMFRDPKRFRQVQNETQAVICGSYALQFFCRSKFSDCDMDLYVELRHAIHICTFLDEESPYRFHPYDSQPHDFISALNGLHSDLGNYNSVEGIHTVLRFKGVYRGLERRIEVVVVKNGYSVMGLLLGFRSSTYNLSWSETSDDDYCCRCRGERDNFSPRILFLSLPWFHATDHYSSSS